jgi:hypothetical protein
MQIEARRNVSITQDFAQAVNFTAVINNVSFIPDEVIVRKITYHHDGTEASAFRLYTDLVGDYIGSFYDGSSSAPNITFPLGRSVQGTYSFKPQTVAGATPAIAGAFFIHLEFVRYRR